MRVDWLLLLCLSFSVDATSHQDGEVDDSVSGAAGATSSSDRRFRVALHAQVSPGQGFVVGSVITTAGMEEAFKARDDVEVAQTFYPFEYKGLHDHQWDLVVIEGWFPMINSFIHEVRALSPSVRVLFYCLDPDFPGLDTITSLDVDGFLTNSKGALQSLGTSAPTLFLPLAASPTWLPCQPHQTYTDLQDKVVYVGSAVAMTTKVLLPPLLRAAAESTGGGLVIYGHGWEGVDEFKRYWHGVLPQEDLCCVYSQAMAVLGMTMDGQRDAGMINNRVFEALACGREGQSRFIAEYFPELEEMFGSYIRYIHEASDLPGLVEELRAGVNIMASRDMILSHHTYAHRVDDVLRFVDQHFGKDGSRSGSLRVGIIHEPDLLTTTEFHVTLGPAVASLQKQQLYQIEWLAFDQMTADGSQGLWTHDSLDSYDALWAVSEWGGPADRIVRSLPPPPETRRGITQRRCLLLWGDSLPDDDNDDDIRAYDVIYYRSEYERRQIESVTSHHNLQHAFGVHVMRATSDLASPHDVSIFDAATPVATLLVSSSVHPFCTEDGVEVQILSTINREKEDLVLSSSTTACTTRHHPAVSIGHNDLGSLMNLFHNSHNITLATEGLQPWVLIAAAMATQGRDSPTLRLTSYDERLVDLAMAWPSDWDLEYYGRSLVAGMTRAFCLGRGRSSVTIVSPSNHSVVWPNQGPLPVHVDIKDFVLGRDGSWCLFVCDHLVTCPQRDDVTLLLDLKHSPTSPAIVPLWAELRSNMYLDVVARSKPIYLFVPADLGTGGDDEGRNDGQTEQGSAHMGLQIVHTVDLKTNVPKTCLVYPV